MSPAAQLQYDISLIGQYIGCSADSSRSSRAVAPAKRANASGNRGDQMSSQWGQP